MTYYNEDKYDPREERLPKWAQGKIDFLRRRLKDAERSAEEARLATKPEESNAIVNPYADIPIGLGKNPLVRFVLNDGPIGWIDARINSMAELEIVGARTIAVQPKSGNVVSVVPVDD